MFCLKKNNRWQYLCQKEYIFVFEEEFELKSGSFGENI
jgi:hypothetical protein